MATPATAVDLAERLRIFRAAAPHFGKVLPASFFQKTSQVLPDVERVHHLIEGIYKPAWSIYPLSISSMLKSQYSDQVHYNSDRTWWIQYSPKDGGMDMAVNAALIRCMTDHQPVAWCYGRSRRQEQGALNALSAPAARPWLWSKTFDRGDQPLPHSRVSNGDEIVCRAQSSTYQMTIWLKPRSGSNRSSNGMPFGGGESFSLHRNTTETGCRLLLRHCFG